MAINRWLGLRLALVAYMVFACGFGEPMGHESWLFVLVFGAGCAFVAFTSSRFARDYDDPFSFTKAFDPLKYPTRFYLLGAIVFISSGVASAAHELYLRGSMSITSWKFFIWGISVSIGLLPSLRNANAKDQTDLH
jgi:hypothetical protein